MIYQKLIKNFATSFAAFLILAISSSAYALDFSNFYFIGDSLTDIGNSPEVAEHSQPDGVNWSQFLSDKFGKQTTASDDGGNNYAYVGAKTDGSHGAVDQTSDLLTKHPKLDRNALYSVWIGANDIKNVLLSGDLPTILAQIVTTSHNITTILKQLHNAGARYILLGNLPDLSLTPYAHDHIPDDLKALVALVSELANATVRNDVNNAGFDVIQVDDFGLLRDVISNPNKFGFQHLSEAMCKNSSDPTCKGYLFWDEIHPTQQAYSMIADYYYSVLVAPTYYGYLAQTPLTIVKNQHNVAKAEIIQQNTLGQLGKAYFFANANTAPFLSVLHSDDQPNNKGFFLGGTMGVLYPISETFLIGGTFGYTQDTTRLSDSVYKFHTNASELALFSNYHKENWFVTATVNGGLLHFSDIQRNAMIGPAQIEAFGDTGGWNIGADLDGAYLIPLKVTPKYGTWRTGPVADLALQRVHVGGYTETGNPSEQEQYELMVYDNQAVNSFTTAVGWEIDFKKPLNSYTYTANLFATCNHEWINGDRDIGFHVLSMSGSHAALPFNVPTYFFFDGGVNLGVTFSNMYTLSLGYDGIFGGDSLVENFVNLGLTISL
jgi:outer membrane lipase/esterase